MKKTKIDETRWNNKDPKQQKTKSEFRRKLKSGHMEHKEFNMKRNGDREGI